MNILTKTVLTVAVVVTNTIAYDTQFNEDRLECVVLHDIFVQNRDNRAIKAHDMFVNIKCEHLNYTPPLWKSYYFEGKEISKKKDRKGCSKGCEEASPFFKTHDEDGNPIIIPHPKHDAKKGGKYV